MKRREVLNTSAIATASAATIASCSRTVKMQVSSKYMNSGKHFAKIFLIGIVLMN